MPARQPASVPRRPPASPPARQPTSAPARYADRDEGKPADYWIGGLPLLIGAVRRQSGHQ